MSIDPADRFYEAIRQDTDDVKLIAQHTGWKVTSIEKIKLHLFVQAHYLDSYEDLGVPAVTARFDSDPIIAESWLRLRAGTHTPLDLALLRHEAAEAWSMRKHGPSYRLAHAAAERRFPVPGRLWS